MESSKLIDLRQKLVAQEKADRTAAEMNFCWALEKFRSIPASPPKGRSIAWMIESATAQMALEDAQATLDAFK